MFQDVKMTYTSEAGEREFVLALSAFISCFLFLLQKSLCKTKSVLPPATLTFDSDGNTTVPSFIYREPSSSFSTDHFPWHTSPVKKSSEPVSWMLNWPSATVESSPSKKKVMPGFNPWLCKEASGVNSNPIIRSPFFLKQISCFSGLQYHRLFSDFYFREISWIPLMDIFPLTIP